ncbi:7TM diverse intracellular signaling domain-containing protein [Bernardetia sp.]|uniref:7TM diverse intracellular signaling domain-containing protein n=1 Tax=Bernardetia sp. TaxID=1937974 RepID=UPI0025C1AD2C|nr:7TM diverse intracellular signaling domain-containing protein [Bernardetia sp.]
MNNFFLCVFCFFFLNILNSIAQQTITINTVDDLFLIGKDIVFLEDTTSSLSIEDILQPKYQNKFQKNDKNVFSRSVSSSAFWFKIRVANFSEEDLWFSTGNIACSYIDFYPPDSLGNYSTVHKTGNLRPKSTRLYDVKNAFWLPLNESKESQTQTYYVRIKQSFPIFLPLEVGTIRSLNARNDINQAITFVFYGVILIMTLYNLFLFFSIRDKVYLIYVGFLITDGWASSYDYSLFEIFSSGETIFFHQNYIILALPSIIFLVWFNLEYLRLKQNAKYVRFVLISLLITAATVLLLSYLGFLDNTFALNIAQILTLLIYILAWGVAIYLLIVKKMQEAFYYVLGWVFQVIATVMLVLVMNGVVTFSVYLQHSSYYGIIMEVWFFSLALGTRFNILKKEKELAQEENLKLVKEQNTLLEYKVEQRTQEVQAKEAKIRKLYEDLSDSIHYAQRIQKAILPTQEKFNELLSRSFVFFKPRDVVSGDFYFLEKIEGKIILAAIDCTGHGVPGAFMSLIGNDLLTEVIINKKITEPHHILQKLHIGIRSLLKQQETNNRDGMDMALVVIDIENKWLEFAGANNPLVYIQNNELEVIKGDKMPIGGDNSRRAKSFTKHRVSLENETVLYLFSDGIQDQFGGEKNKKFSPKRLRNLLLEHHQKPMDEQQAILRQTIESWQQEGKEKQIDDMLLVGVKV